MSVRFVLVRPRNPLNIGAVARAMANFGLRDLIVVEPHAPVWREARSAPGAGPVLASARALGLGEALADTHLALGTADPRRRGRQETVELPELPAFLKERLPRGGRLAVLFGSEKTGLGNEALDRCHALLRIPTSPQAPSMNLGQAAALVAYQLSLSGAASRPMPDAAGETCAAAAGRQLEELLRLALAAFDRLGYMSRSPAAAKASRLRRMFLGWRLSSCDAALLQAIFRRVAAG